MDISLNTYDKNKVLNLNNLQLFESSSGKTDLYVYSDGFSVEQPFYFDNIEKFISDLKNIYDTLKGAAILKPDYEQDYIKFIADKMGHIVVEGETFWHSEFPQNIHFSFQTDQTVLMPFIIDLETAVKK